MKTRSQAMVEETQQLRDLRGHVNHLHASMANMASKVNLHSLTTKADQLETRLTDLQLEMRQMFQSLLSTRAGTGGGHQDSGRATMSTTISLAEDPLLMKDLPLTMASNLRQSGWNFRGSKVRTRKLGVARRSNSLTTTTPPMLSD